MCAILAFLAFFSSERLIEHIPRYIIHGGILICVWVIYFLFYFSFFSIFFLLFFLLFPIAWDGYHGLGFSHHLVDGVLIVLVSHTIGWMGTIVLFLTPFVG